MKIVRTAAPVRQQVTDQIRAAIVEMRFAPRQRLIERELTEMTGVSRPTVREALQQLSAEGLVTTEPGHGWVVAALTKEEAEDLYAVRSLLEGLAGRRFVERADDDQVAALREAFDEIRAAVGDRDRYAAAKNRFYDVLFDGAGSATMATIIGGLHARVTTLRALSTSRPGRAPRSVAEIEAIVGAIEARDPDAASEACAHHVRQAALAAFASLGETTWADADGESREANAPASANGDGDAPPR